MSIVQGVSQIFREFSEFGRLLSPENEPFRKLVFYSEGAFQYRYLVDYIDYVLENSDIPICYITSQHNDPILTEHHNRVHPFFIKNTLAATFQKLDSKVIVMTAPDLNNSSIKRAPLCSEHIYAMHGVGSIHQGYRLGAFDHYDSILCIGQFQKDELAKAEAVYALKKKQLILTGYPYLEDLHRSFLKYNSHYQRAKPICLIAPTWAPINKESSLMHETILPLLDVLQNSEFELWLRPHPEYIKRNPGVMKKLMDKFKAFPNVKVETNLPSLNALFEADVLITDHSSIAFDFAFGTERPVLFIDTPTRVDNPEVERLQIEPIENRYRGALGARISPKDLSLVPTKLTELLLNKDFQRAHLMQLRKELIANWGNATTVGGNYILSRCQ